MKKHILIVDDEKTFLYAMEIIIKKFDSEFEIYTANSAKKALVLTSSSDIDLLLTDIVMPDMDGLELIKVVRKKRPSIKIIAISGAGNLHLKAAEVFGASYVLNKPFEMDDLKSAIHKALN